MKPSHAAQSSRNAAQADDLSSLDHDAWQTLYANIDDPDTAQAVLEMADTVPEIMKRYPSLVIQARRTRVRLVNEPKRNKTRRTLLGSFGFVLGSLTRMVFRRRVKSRPAPQAKVVSLASFVNGKPRKVFSVKSSSRVAGGGR